MSCPFPPMAAIEQLRRSGSFLLLLTNCIITQQCFAQKRRWAPLPLSADAVAGLPITNVANQQSFLGAVLDWTDGEVQLVGEVQDSSGTYSSDWHNKLFPFCDAGELVEVILQGKKQPQQTALSTVTMAEENLLFSMTLTVALNNVIALFTLMTFNSSSMTWTGLLTPLIHLLLQQASRTRQNYQILWFWGTKIE